MYIWTCAPFSLLPWISPPQPWCCLPEPPRQPVPVVQLTPSVADQVLLLVKLLYHHLAHGQNLKVHHLQRHLCRKTKYLINSRWHLRLNCWPSAILIKTTGKWPWRYKYKVGGKECKLAQCKIRRNKDKRRQLWRKTRWRNTFHVEPFFCLFCTPFKPGQLLSYNYFHFQYWLALNSIWKLRYNPGIDTKE